MKVYIPGFFGKGRRWREPIRAGEVMYLWTKDETGRGSDNSGAK